MGKDVPPAPSVTSPLGRLFTVAESAAYLGMDEATLRREIRARRLRVLRRGRALSVYQTWCDEYIEQCSVPADGTTRGHVDEPAIAGGGIRNIKDIVPRHSPIGN